MKAILDESVPRGLIPALRDFECTVQPFPNEWKGLKNGKLLDQLEQSGFDCLVTCDKNMQWQQPLRTRRVSVVVLPLQKLSLLKSIARQIAGSIASVKPGEIGRPGIRNDEGEE